MKLEIEITTASNAMAKAVAAALAADARPKRGSAGFKAKGSKLLMEIKTNDKVAMRAAVNSSLRVADACLSVLGDNNG